MLRKNSGLIDRLNPLPFEHLFLSYVQRAREKMLHHVKTAAYELLTPAAHAGWDRYLLMRLAAAGAKAAQSQFEIFKTVRAAFPKTQNVADGETNSQYREFVGDDPVERLQKLCSEFPALSKLCDILVENWIATLVEFLSRLEADRHRLNEMFHGEPFAFPVKAIQAGLSDPHRGGRCVVRLCFENGVSLIYKPRSVEPEDQFAALIETINRGDIPHPLKPARCWDRGTYGWMENISPSACNVSGDVHTFYWRTGALLGLVYLAHGVDIHRENLVATGEHPVLIDLEALCHPQSNRGTNASGAASVLRTGFLPYSNSAMGTSYGWSALGRSLRSERSATQWVHINQDDMKLTSERQKFPEQFHLPIFAGQPCLAAGYLADILEGYRWVGKSFLGNQGFRGDFEEWLCRLAGSPRRLIIGSTVAYQAALEEFTTPQSLRKSQLVADAVRNSAAGASEVEHETKALEQFDVPYFALPEWGRDRPDGLSFRLPTKKRYSAQERVITNSLLGIPQQWQEPEPELVPTK